MEQISLLLMQFCQIRTELCIIYKTAFSSARLYVCVRPNVSECRTVINAALATAAPFHELQRNSFVRRDCLVTLFVITKKLYYCNP